jgi:uncharacterized protein (DUF1800 family)
VSIFDSEAWQKSARSAGLGAREAVEVLLGRWAFGARPGEAARVVRREGPDGWLRRELGPAMADPGLEARLSGFEALGMTHQALIARYPDSLQVEGHARRFHGLLPPRDEPVMDPAALDATLERFRAEQGFLRQDRELREQLLAQRILRAVYAEQQLREVLTDFWLHHFFANATIFRARPWTLALEQEAIRPHVLGPFRELLHAVAKHPGMLGFHAASAAAPGVGPADTLLARRVVATAGGAASDSCPELAAAVERELAALAAEQDALMAAEFWPPGGPNDEFARGLIELHTLGPDGPYTHVDVAEAARVLTGWTTMPIGPSPAWFDGVLDQVFDAGFVREGTFLFRADWHDATDKFVLGERYADGGLADGERLLDRLASHPATAWHIARKLAARFVADAPPDAVVEHVAARFIATQGDLAAVVAALLETPEFWRAGAARSKVKSPFEYAVSALRATAAEIADTREIAAWVERMGQALYVYHDPGGYPEHGGYWLDAGSLLARINFAAALADGTIDGVAIDANPSARRALARSIAAPEFQLR